MKQFVLLSCLLAVGPALAHEVDYAAKTIDMRIAYVSPTVALRAGSFSDIQRKFSSSALPVGKRTQLRSYGLALGEIRGWKTHFMLVSDEKSQTGMNEAVLRDADVVILVIAAGAKNVATNAATLERLRSTLKALKRPDVPIVLQIDGPIVPRDTLDIAPTKVARGDASGSGAVAALKLAAKEALLGVKNER